MATLFLDRKDLGLRFEGNCIALYEQGEKSGTVPLHLLERVVILGQVTLDSRLLGALAESNIGVLMLSGRNHRCTASLLGKPHNDVLRRFAQYEMYHHQAIRLRFCRWLVLAKLRKQRQLLSEALSLRPDLRKTLTDAFGGIGGVIEQLTSSASECSLAQLRGFEGAAAALYFKAFTALFAPSLDFTSRQRRPPTYPVNACLSLGYTLLHYDAVKACQMAGLDPFIGVFHDLAFARESLACDVIELLRCDLDALVWRLFRERVLRAEYFSHTDGKVTLNKSGRKHFFAEYERFAKPVRRLLRRYGFAYAQRLVSEYKQL